MDNDYFGKTNFYTELKMIVDKETVNPQEIFNIKGLMNRKDYDSLFANDRDNLKSFFIEIMKKDYRILDEIYEMCKNIPSKGVFKKTALDYVKDMPILGDKNVALALVQLNGYSISYLPNKIARDLDIIKASRESFMHVGVYIDEEDIEVFDMFDNKSSIYRYFYRSRTEYPYPTFLPEYDLEKKIKTTILEFLDYLINYKVLYNKDMAFNLWGVTTQNLVQNNNYNSFVLCNSTICGIPLVSFVSYLIGDIDTQYVFRLHQAPGVPVKLTKKEETKIKKIINRLMERHEIFMGIINKIYQRIEDHLLPSDFIPTSHNVLMILSDAYRQGEKQFVESLMEIYGRIYSFSAVVMDDKLITIDELNRIRESM